MRKVIQVFLLLSLVAVSGFIKENNDYGQDKPSVYLADSDEDPLRPNW